MKKGYLKIDPWEIIEEDFDPKKVKASESIFSLGNGAMGQRANFEEEYSGDTFQGSYIGGVYYPDKTKVGWWKNGYPEYFAKVINAPNWIGIHIKIGGHKLDLNKCKDVKNFKRVLNMKTGIYTRSFEVQISNDYRIAIEIKRFLSMAQGELGAIKYKIKALEGSPEIIFDSFIDGNIKNQDSNWDDPFWSHKNFYISDELILLHSQTLKTEFDIATYAQSKLLDEHGNSIGNLKKYEKENRISQVLKYELNEGSSCTLIKFGGYINGLNHLCSEFNNIARELVTQSHQKGFDVLAEEHSYEWNKIWNQSDIQIKGDDKAQQGIRFNIFQLNQTYNGHDSRLNIGPKGFTGEKYGGSTYWDTEAYCLPFYMATKDQNVARNLLKYRYDQLDKAIENASKLGFNDGAALYPMVTMNGEECHNEWEITFEEIHRNGAIAFAIFNYERYTGDTNYILEMGIEVLIAITRFWIQRVNYSEDKKAYVMLGVTGPNEYENNINNNWYTNYIAKWCIEYTLKEISKVKKFNTKRWEVIIRKIDWDDKELDLWNDVAEKIYLPKHPKKDIYLQQDGFLDKEFHTASMLKDEERPINQNWSWDRILRSPFIKQADVLQGFYLFEDHFNKKMLEQHFDFYEPLTVHESSLSPCIHSILASRLGRTEQAYSFYLRTSRLDLDDYNKEVDEGLHITSMAGTWMSVVEGFGGVRVLKNQLHIDPILPNSWEEFSFRINFRNTLIKVVVKKNEIDISYSNPDLIVYCKGEKITI